MPTELHGMVAKVTLVRKPRVKLPLDLQFALIALLLVIRGHKTQRLAIDKNQVV